MFLFYLYGIDDEYLNFVSDDEIKIVCLKIYNFFLM